MAQNISRWRLLLLLPLCAGLAQAQDPMLVHRDLQTIRRLAALQLTGDQAQAISGLLSHIGALLAEQQALAAEFNRITADDVLSAVAGELAGQPPAEALRATLAEHTATYAAQRAALDEEVLQAANTVWLSLYDVQRAMIESDEQARARRAQAHERGQRADQAVAAAAKELTWVRNASDADYAAGRVPRAVAVTATMYPNADQALGQAVTGAVLGWFEQARAMSSTQFNARQVYLVGQLRQLLNPPAPRTAATPVMSNEDWVELIKNPRTLYFLQQMTPALPVGVQP